MPGPDDTIEIAACNFAACLLEATIPKLSEIYWRAIWHRLTIRFDKRPIQSPGALVEFLGSRAAYVAQTSLYGYLKTRIGTRYPEVFQDQAFAASIDIAKWQIFAACLADLTIFAVANVARGDKLESRDAEALARSCFEGALREAGSDPDSGVDIAETVSAFASRAEATDWTAAALGEAAFRQSPAALVEWAPVVKEFKEMDREIVTNSIRFRWRDVRDQMRRRVDGEALSRQWKRESD